MTSIRDQAAVFGIGQTPFSKGLGQVPLQLSPHDRRRCRTLHPGAGSLEAFTRPLVDRMSTDPTSRKRSLNFQGNPRVEQVRKDRIELR